MARVTKIVIGEVNFTETACGFAFKASVCEPEEEIDDTHIRVRRLVTLFPGSTVETVNSKKADVKKVTSADDPKPPAETKATEPKVETPAPNGDAKNAQGPAPEAKTEEPPAEAAPATANAEVEVDPKGEPVEIEGTRDNTVGEDDAPAASDELKEKLSAENQKPLSEVNPDAEVVDPSEETAEIEPEASEIEVPDAADQVDVGESAEDADEAEKAEDSGE